MHNIIVKSEINSPIESVWSTIDDFGAIYLFNPDVKSSNIIGDKATGLGAKRVCNFNDGTSLKETITKYLPNEGFDLELSEFSVPLEEARAQFRLTPVPNDRTLVTISMSFKPKFGPLGWVMGKLLMSPMMSKALKGLTKGLNDYLETGQQIGKSGVLLGAR